MSLGHIYSQERIHGKKIWDKKDVKFLKFSKFIEIFKSSQKKYIFRKSKVVLRYVLNSLV